MIPVAGYLTYMLHRFTFFYSSQFVLLVDLWLVRLLTAKAPSPNFCLADNELGVKGAMFVIRKVGSDVQGVKGRCGETNMAFIKFIFNVFTFAYSNGQETNFLRRV